VVEPIEIFLGQKLAREESGPAETFEAAARGANRNRFARRTAVAVGEL
jgi:hypothetical protein